MHIKNIHSMIEKLSECAKCELDKGIDNVDTKEMGEVAEIIKELAEAEYYSKISKAMDEAEYGEDYDVYGPMEHERRGYRGQRRDSRGRYMGSRRGYDEMMPMDHERMEHMRDMDREGMNRMYYPSSSSMNGNISGGRDYREGRSGQTRRSYMEKKELHKNNTAEDKQAKLKELEAYMADLSSDITEMISGATTEEKNMLKTKIQTLAQKIS